MFPIVGADPNLTRIGGWTPLHWAAYEGHKDVVLLLLDRGTGPNLASEDGLTPLYWAASQGHNDVVLLHQNE